MKKLSLIAFITFMSIPTQAYDFELNGIYYNKIEQTGMAIIAGGTNSGTFYYINVEVTNKEGQTSGSFQQTVTGSLVIPETFTYSNGPSAKYYCTVTKIGNLGLANATLITSLTLPSTIKTIGDMAFLVTNNLNTIKMLAETPPTYNTSYILFNDGVYNNATLYVPEGCVNKYKSASGWKNFKNIVEMGPQINGYECVDLGLPSGLLWATTNIGTGKPEGKGNYYAWGETTTKSNYTWGTYKYAGGSATTLTKYNWSANYGNVDNKEVLAEEDDVAMVQWGSPWHTPTLSETQELRNKCSWEKTTMNGIAGYQVTGPNGNYIFLPCYGVKQYSYELWTSDMCIQTSTLFNASNGKPSSASVLYAEQSEIHYWYGWDRCWGYQVRPVTNKNAAGVSPIRMEDSKEIFGIYNLQGHKLDYYQKGVNIIRYKNGKTKKIIK